MAKGSSERVIKAVVVELRGLRGVRIRLANGARAIHYNIDPFSRYYARTASMRDMKEYAAKIVEQGTLSPV